MTGYRLDSPDHQRWLVDRGADLLEFARPSLDPVTGSFGALDVAGRRLPGPRALFATARMTYCFALSTLDGRPDDGRLVEAGLQALRTGFHDDRSGGWFAELVDDGSAVLVADKQTYGHAFVLLALSCAHQAGFACADLLEEAAAVFDRRLWEPEAGACVESWDRSWLVCDPYRGFNANMHAVEAFLGAYSATGRPVFRERAGAVCRRLMAAAGGAQWRVPEHFAADWTPRPDYNRDHPDDQFRPFGTTPGHALEWCRLLLQIRRADADAKADDGGTGGELLAAAEALFDRAVADAWDPERCGFAYTVDAAGREVIGERLHWVLAEAIGAARYLYGATGRPDYATWYERFWEVADRCFIDRQGGGWWHELGAGGVPTTRIWSGKPDLYHALQATFFGRLPCVPSLAGELARALS